MSAPLGHLSKNVCSEILREAYSQYLKIYKSSSIKVVANEIENGKKVMQFLIATGVRPKDCERKRAKLRAVISCCVFNIC